MDTTVTKNETGMSNEALIEKFVTNDIFASISPMKPGTMLITGESVKMFEPSEAIDEFYINSAEAILKVK